MLAQPSFGRRLRQLRQQRHKTQADLAGPGMSAAYLSRLESGSRPPTERAVDYLAQRLEVPVTAFHASHPTDLVDVLAEVLVSSGNGEFQRQRLQEALNHEKPCDPALRWQAHAQLARLLGEEGDREAELEVLTALNALSDEVGNPSIRLHSRLRLARCLRALGRAQPARTAAQEGMAIASNASLTGHDTVRCRLLLASVAAELGDLAEASRLSTEVCEELETETGSLAAEAFWTAATVSTRQGNHTRSTALLEHALEVLDSRNDLTLWMRLRLAAAALALRAMPANLERAEAYLDQVQPALNLIGKVLHLHEYAFLRAQLAYAKGDIKLAADLCEQAQQTNAQLTFRDRVRLQMLQEQINVRQSDPEAGTRLRNLAIEAESRGMLDLAAEVWRAAAQAPLIQANPH
ncbi:helix-turn-helix domain-containing protein [Streptomyces sp. SAS_267]|uniref:helix-turn-helix domain-containing protein n=1 Tax=Streptomyces sp. SAS_267 TaxID=3412750 RepID=UPI00403CEAD4